MAGRIPDSDIARVRELSPVVDVIGEHVTLRNAGGGSLKGLCPFHDERSPSFNVTPARGFWHCFGCGEGGDVISFVQKIDHLSFTEAVERLAARVNYELHYEQGGSAPRAQQGQRARLVEAHRLAAQYFAEQLESPEAVIGRRFLDERGFDAASASHFGVGYAPTGWEHLVKHLRSKGFSDEELAISGLASHARQGSLIDRFRGRLVWPIRDVTGDVVGFGARKLREDDDGPKYLNTPETPLYKKSQVLYGIDLAKRDIAKARQAVVVEGYTDVMACHLAGVTTAVATCGTAFGEDHVRILRRLLLDSAEYAGEVIFTFDGDSAGQKAALRAFETDQKFVTHTFVAISPDNMDPCELRIDKGDPAVRDLVARRQPLFEFAVRSVLAGFDLEIPEGRVAALERTAPLVAQIKDTSLRDEYARRLAGWVGAPDELAVLERVRRLAAPSGNRPPSRGAGAERPDPRDPTLQVEREALKLAVQRPALLGPAFDALDPLAFTSGAYGEVRDAIAKAGGTGSTPGGDAWVTAVLESCVDDRVRHLITELVVEPVLTAAEPDVRYAAAQLARLRVRALDRQIAELKSRLQRVNPIEQSAEHNKLFGELITLEKRRRDDLEGSLNGS